MRCPGCGYENPAGRKICGQCAAPHTEPPTAHQPHVPFGDTPKRLTEKILTSTIALEGERKQVTVLFADLKGSMELLADRDPEDARAILDRVLERMMDAVHRYEGVVIQVMGDGIMTLLYPPIAHADHAVRACYAALAMQTSIHQYAAKAQHSNGVPIQIQVGLSAGRSWFARSAATCTDYTAVGHTTHLAARMEQVANPVSILITPEVFQLAEGYVQVEALGVVTVKRLSVPIEVYELVGAGHVRTRLQAAAARGLTRFVGRDAELHILHQA